MTRGPNGNTPTRKRWPPSPDRIMATGFAFVLVRVIGGIGTSIFSTGELRTSASFAVVGLASLSIGWKRGGRLRLQRSCK